jgi:outer membrane protein OmpA-like peptidoglycan-associated protein
MHQRADHSLQSAPNEATEEHAIGLITPACGLQTMRRASLVLIPAALVSFLGLGYLAFEDELNLLRVEIASLLDWGESTTQDESVVVSEATPAQPARSELAARKLAALKSSTDLASIVPSIPSESRKGLKIDFARVNGEGVSVIGGRAPAHSRVSVRANGEVVAVVTASDDGQWSAIVTRAFPAGPLGLSVTSDATSTAGLESPTVTVQVPKGADRLELAVAEPKARPILPPRGPSEESRAVNEFAAMVERARTCSAQDGSPKPEAKIVPVPITFQTGEETLTAEGMQAAHLLAEYVRIMKPHTITLSGHADVRGSDDYNFDLSRRRLETIRSFLRENGYAGDLTLLAKGKSEPYTGIDRKTASVQEVYQADRRVELRLAE